MVKSKYTIEEIYEFLSPISEQIEALHALCCADIKLDIRRSLANNQYEKVCQLTTLHDDMIRAYMDGLHATPAPEEEVESRE